MFRKCELKFVDDMVKNGIIRKEDTELYLFGIEALKTYVLSIAMTLFIGTIMDSFFESLIFLLLFWSMRAEVGGYHASARKMCMFISIFTLISSLFTIKLLVINMSFICFVFLLCFFSFFIMSLAPLPDANKPINDREVVYHKRRAKLIVCSSDIIAMLSFRKLRNVSITILIVEAVVFISFIVWLIFRYKQERRN